MADYRLTVGGVIDLKGGWFVPEDSENARWAIYQAWLDAGGVPKPAITPTFQAPVA